MILVWFVSLILLFLYSFTQVDLGLTLTRLSAWQGIQHAFQYIGYFNRPLSTALFIGILILLIFGYFWILKEVRKGKITTRKLWRMIILTAIIAGFSYNAFSHDFFNYIFYGKIITFYHANPYQHKALDFVGDPMLGFMHWTHNYYPYGPTWLILTVPLSILGFQVFLLNMFLFKGLAIVSYLGIIKAIEKILEKFSPNDKLLGMAIFAFSPLVLIEGLVSAHNDLVMFFLSSIALWFVIDKKYLPAWVLFLFSVGIKFATGVLFPVFLLLTFFRAKLSLEKVFFLTVFLMIVPFVLVINRSEFQPWYLLYFWPTASLLPRKNWLLAPLFLASLGGLLSYIPFLNYGSWTNEIVAQKLNIATLLTVFGLLAGELILLKGYFIGSKK